MEQEKSKFKFEGYKISHSELNLSESPSDCTKFSIGIKAKANVKDNHFYLKLDTTVANEDNSVFANVIMTGEFIFDKDISKDMLGGLFCANAPAIMFPYIRSYISTLTALSGSDTVIVPTLTMSSLRGEILQSLNEKNS